jgi:hypothetical protein
VERNVQTIIISELLGHTQPLQGFGCASRITPGYAHATYDAMGGRWICLNIRRKPRLLNKSQAKVRQDENEIKATKVVKCLEYLI